MQLTPQCHNTTLAPFSIFLTWLSMMFLNRHFSKHDIRIQWVHEECSTPLITRELQTNTIVRYYLTPLRSVVIKMTKIVAIAEYSEEKKLFSIGENVSWYSHCRKQCRGASKMSIAALFMIDKKWKQPKCPSTGEWLEKTWHICTTDYHSDAKQEKSCHLQ